MRKHAKLTAKQKVNIIKAYSEELIPMRTLANKYGVTRQAIYKILKRAQINTAKGAIAVSCTTCGNPIMRIKSRIRKQLHHFCNSKCYYTFLQAGNGFPYIDSTYHRRIARSITNQHFTLQEGHVVHHENRNQTDNRLENLRVFTTQGDHIRYHRGFDVLPIWNGENP